LKQIFIEYGKLYANLLEKIYPAKNSTGFAERNLSVNFAKAYEKMAEGNNQEIYTWYEFQFGEKNNLHVDAVIINETAKELLIIESKRYNNPQEKIKEVGKDIYRIQELVDELKRENTEGIYRIKLNQMERCRGIILADVWAETDAKREILEAYTKGIENHRDSGAFLKKYERTLGIDASELEVQYDVQSFKTIDAVKNYNLVSFWWDI